MAERTDRPAGRRHDQRDRRRWRWAILVLGLGAVLAGVAVAAGPLAHGLAPTDRPTGAPTSGGVPPTETSLPLEFDPVSLAGRGDERVGFSIPEAAAAIAAVTNSGTGAFGVSTVAAGGTLDQVLVETSGAYSGLLLFDARPGQHSVAFDVRSGGAWTIRVEPVALAPSWSGSIPLSGTGDDVALLDTPADGSTAILIEHGGSGRIAVFAYTTSGELDQLVDATGSLDEAHDVPAGTVVFEVRAVGRWTLTPG
jgi:hypothetical protein